jgi:hypothetical protein
MEVPGFERKQHENLFNYTDDQLQEKQLALKTMKELWPDVPAYYAEIIYDMCKNSTPEQIEEIKKKCEEPFKYAKKEINEK